MTKLLENAPMPVSDRISRAKRRQYAVAEKADPDEGRITEPWQDWMTRQADTVNLAAVRINSVQLRDKSTSEAADFSGGGIPEGLYRVSYYAQISRAATTSSQLDVLIAWLTNGIAQSFQGAAITGNTLDTHQAEVFMFRSDGGAPIAYSTTYASVGATSMRYDIDIVLERVKA